MAFEQAPRNAGTQAGPGTAAINDREPGDVVAAEFDRAFYLGAYPDVAASGVDPLEHFLRWGWAEGRNPSPDFDTAYYLKSNPDVAASGTNPFHHFITQGRAQGRAPYAPRARQPSEQERDAVAGEFDAAYYLSTYADVAQSGVDPLEHFLAYGWAESRNPRPDFDTAYYLGTNPDVAASGMNPFYHFLTVGRAEGRAAQRRPLPDWEPRAAQPDGPSRGPRAGVARALRAWLPAVLPWLRPISRAQEVAREDDKIAAAHAGRRFAYGSRPVLRWIKGDGFDDHVTRAAIAQATRLFGREVDYCLCTAGIDAARARSLLEWAVEPVEWWPLSPEDNPRLAAALHAAGCPPDRYGYWWKWFPERVRVDGPEWILDGDMVVTRPPAWYEQWRQGEDACRVSQDDRAPREIYGSYADLVDERQRLYSGLISLPPRLRYMDQFEAILAEKALASGHDGRVDMSEQGVVAAAFQRIGAVPIPLNEFPFGRAWEDFIDYGLRGDEGLAWGYHFGGAFRRHNPHFERLVGEGRIFSRADQPSVVERFAWLGGYGQWGVPGWTMADACASIMVEHARQFAGRSLLELGTSRGRVTAMLATVGCHVTTVDRHDRGARQNLEGLDVRVVVQDALEYLERTSETFDCIVVDLHGNSVTDWQRRGPLLKKRLAPGGMLLLDNAVLWKVPEWRDETGVSWFLDGLRPPWRYEVYADCLPGVAVVTHG